MGSIYPPLPKKNQNKEIRIPNSKTLLSCLGTVWLQCHKAKNLVPDAGGKPTKVGKKCLELQHRLPLARIVYCSATGAQPVRDCLTPS